MKHMENDEARMTNVEGSSNDERLGAFGFRHSFVIRHSSFAILR
jgi:hypothetical protein